MTYERHNHAVYYIRRRKEPLQLVIKEEKQGGTYHHQSTDLTFTIVCQSDATKVLSGWRVNEHKNIYYVFGENGSYENYKPKN